MSAEQKKKIQGYSNAMNAMEYKAALDGYYTNKRNEETIAGFKDKLAAQTWEQNEKIRQLQVRSQVDAYDKNQKVYDKTIDAIDFAAEDARERVKLGLDEQIADMAFRYDDLERDLYKESFQMGIQYDAAQQSLDDAISNSQMNYQVTQLEKISMKEELEQRENQATGEYRKKQMDLRIQQLQDQGALAARGVSGKSAARAQKTVAAVSGLNQQQIADSLYYSDQAIASKRKEFFGNGQNLSREELKSMSAKEVRKQGGKFAIKSKQELVGRDQKKKEVARQQKEITEFLGITTEEFNMSREKIAESLMSASKGAELKLKEIKTKEFEAKSQAFAGKMVKPRFVGPSPVPFKTPKTQYTKPQPAPFTPKMPMGGRGANRPASGASMALGIGAAALGAVGTAATGGLLGAGMVGAGAFMTGGAGILGGISKLFG